jgi:NAD(P)-dependent dehydrogenase (short-subunit alcohol dehydrogenase family)
MGAGPHEASAADRLARAGLPPEARGAAAGRERLVGRRIAVVGAGTRPSDEPDAPIGNGRAIALLAVREGAAVACVDAEAEAARETLRRIEKEGGRGVVVQADVTQESDCARLVAESEQALGGLDGLVLNVGIGEGMGLAGTDAGAWDRTLGANLRGHFLVARAALGRLPEGASIVFIGSIAGRRAGSRLPAYDASKAGLEALCRHVALEGAARGVRANIVVPGLIDTPLGRLATRGRPARARARVPLGRQGTGWEVAYAAIFLLSNEASYVTGQDLVVDGGLSELR